MAGRDFVPEEVNIDPASGWEAACSALQMAVNDMATTITEQARTIAALRTGDVQEEFQVMQENSAVLQSQLGDLYDLVQNHGTLSEVMADLMALTTRSTADVAVLTLEITALNQAMSDFCQHTHPTTSRD